MPGFASSPVAPPWGNFPLFVVCLVVALASDYYMVRRVLTEPLSGGEAACGESREEDARLDGVVSRDYIVLMRSVGVRELKSRLSAYLRMVRDGEEILVTDRGEVVAELRRPGRTASELRYPALALHAREGRVRLGEPNRPESYAVQPRIAPEGTAARLLDEERGER